MCSGSVELMKPWYLIWSFQLLLFEAIAGETTNNNVQNGIMSGKSHHIHFHFKNYYSIKTYKIRPAILHGSFHFIYFASVRFQFAISLRFDASDNEYIGHQFNL